MGNIIIKIVGAAVRAASPELRSIIADALHRMRAGAAQTESAWDDILVDVLSAVLGFED